MKLLLELPTHLRDVAAFALATGLRRANITGLTWEQVDLRRKLAWVHPDQAKARRAIAVPLNDMAMKVLGRQVGLHPSGARLHVPEQAHLSGEHDGLVPRAQARRYRELQVPRPEAHLGKLARAERDAALCLTGTRRLGNGANGAALCAPERGSPRAMGRTCANPWHIPGTPAELPENAR